MGKVITTTTDFKRALKTVTDTLTASEKKTFDVGIHIYYEGNTGTITMRHPLNQMVVTADFSGEEYDGVLDMLFFQETLSEDLKKYRKKEPLYLDKGMGTILFSTEDSLVFEGALIDDEIPVPQTSEVYSIDRKEFIQVLNISQSITKTTFHESTMSIQFVAVKDKLHMKSTNFAQMAVSELTLDKRVQQPFQVTLSAKEVTKVRNVVERGKSEHVSFSKSDDYLILKTDITSVAFIDQEGISHLNANNVLKNIEWKSGIYKLDTDSGLGVVEKQYDELLEAETYRDEEGNRDDDWIASKEIVYLKRNTEDMTIEFSQEPKEYQVGTRDIKDALSKMPSELETAFSDETLFLNYETDTMKVRVLVPVITVV